MIDSKNMPSNVKKIYYWDSSALVKKYIAEEGSKEIISYYRNAKEHVSSVITFSEILATFYRLYREGSIRKDDLKKITEEFKKDWQLINKMPYSDDLQEESQKIITSVQLKGGDLIHISSAVSLKNEGLEFTFLTFDNKLKNIALDLGLICD